MSMEEGKPFISRQVKASWGIDCNQSADGKLWVSKGCEVPFADQLGEPQARHVAEALERVRGNRCGRFWVDMKNRVVTMAVGPSAENKYQKAKF